MSDDASDLSYSEEAQHELDLASLTDNPGDKKRHLDKAATFATLHERSRAPHAPPAVPE